MADKALKLIAYGTSTVGLMTTGLELVKGGAQYIKQFIDFVTPPFRDAWEWISSWFKTPVPQNTFIEGLPNLGNEVYRQRVICTTRNPYTVTHKLRHPSQEITGISCQPISKNMQSPETKITAGGINYNEVTLVLTPVQDGEWGCIITLCASVPQTK